MSLDFLAEMQKYLLYCSVGIFAIVLKHTARRTEMANLKDVSWLNLAFVDIHYLNVCATVFHSAQPATRKELCNAHLSV